MFNITDYNTSFILMSPERTDASIMENKFYCDKLLNMLYSKSYTVIPLVSYEGGLYEKVYISISPYDNDQTRMDAIFFMNEFLQGSSIVKYREEDTPKKIQYDGSEIPLSINIYESDMNKKVYIHNGISFSFAEMKKYFFPQKKEDLKSGLIIEYFSNNRWVPKKIGNLDMEYNNMYKLLMKYEKVRLEY